MPFLQYSIIIFLSSSTNVIFYFSCGASARVRVMFPSYGAPRSHLFDTQHSVRNRTGNQPEAETSTWQDTTLTADYISCSGGIRTRNPSKRAAAELTVSRRRHCRRQRHFTKLETGCMFQTCSCYSDHPICYWCNLPKQQSEATRNQNSDPRKPRGK